MEDESRSVSGFLHFDTASKGNHCDCWLFISKVYLLLKRQEGHHQKGLSGEESNRYSKQQQYMKQSYLVGGGNKLKNLDTDGWSEWKTLNWKGSVENVYLCKDEMGEWQSIKFIANSRNSETVAKAEHICIFMAKNISPT